MKKNKNEMKSRSVQCKPEWLRLVLRHSHPLTAAIAYLALACRGALHYDAN